MWVVVPVFGDQTAILCHNEEQVEQCITEMSAKQIEETVWTFNCVEFAVRNSKEVHNVPL